MAIFIFSYCSVISLLVSGREGMFLPSSDVMVGKCCSMTSSIRVFTLWDARRRRLILGCWSGLGIAMIEISSMSGLWSEGNSRSA